MRRAKGIAIAVGQHAADEGRFELCTPPLRFQAAMARRRRIGLAWH
jgi:hypothetical protein